VDHTARRWDLALIGICALWGATFTMIRDIVVVMPPFLYIALRFALAALTLAAFGGFRGLRRAELRAGIVIGLPLFAGYAFQITGQQYTSPSNAGFITGLFIVITPVLSALVSRKLPSGVSIGAVVLATGGLVLLAMPAGFHLQHGDALILGTAFAFAIHIMFIARMSKGRSALRLVAVQTATAAIIAGTDAVAWLSQRRFAARLVRSDGYPPHADRFSAAGFDLPRMLGGEGQPLALVETRA